jgi:cupin superfamily acireductone dioxygenase involved in methionine salvage
MSVSQKSAYEQNKVRNLHIRKIEKQDLINKSSCYHKHEKKNNLPLLGGFGAFNFMNSRNI